MYVVGRKRLKVEGGWRAPGAPLPEAATWKHIDGYIRLGAVELLSMPAEPAAAEIVAVVVPERCEPERAYQCGVCGKTWDTQGSLNLHRSSKHGIRRS